MYRNSHTFANTILKSVGKAARSAGSAMTFGISGRQWLASALVCAMMWPLFVLPTAAFPPVDLAAGKFEPVNEQLPFWIDTWRSLNAKLEVWAIPFRAENVSNDLNDDEKKGTKKPIGNETKKTGAAETENEKLNKDNTHESEKVIPADSHTELQAGSKNDSPLPRLALMNEPADRPILDDTQIASLFSSDNNLGSPLGQTEASARFSPAATRTRERAGIGNYSFGISAASLPGRNLDASIGISYNSQLWTESYNQFTYNVDGNWLAPGFQIGYGYLDAYRDGIQAPTTFVLTETDGTRRQFDYISGTSGYGSNWVYETNDGSFTRIEFTLCTGSPCSPQWQGPLLNLRVTYSDGSKVFYPYTANPQNRYFPTKVIDVQGNYISINYLANDEVGKISYITDTLGRNIDFHYENTADQKLIAITVPGYDGSSTPRQTIRFYYQDITLQSQNRFSGTIVAPSSISVLKYVYFPGTKTGYRYDYSSYYGMIYKITRLDGMQVTTDSLSQLGSVNETTYLESAWTRYNYPGTDIEPPSPTLSDVPKYNKRIDDWVGRTGSAPEIVYSITEDTNTRTTQITTPDNTTTVSVSHKKPGQWDDGLLKETSMTSPSRTQPWSKSIYTWQYGEITRGRRNPRIEKLETTNDAGLARATTFSYDAYNNQTQIKEHDFAASGSVGTELRRTEISYQTGGQYNLWIYRNILHLPTSVKTIVDNTIVSRADYEYDGSPLTPYGEVAVIQHDQAYNPDAVPGQYCHLECPNECEDPSHPQNCYCDRVEICDPIPVYDGSTAYRGNVTKVTNFVDPTNNNDPDASVNTLKYDITGNVVEASANCCNLKTWEYSAANKYAYPTKEIKGTDTQLTTLATFDFNTGLMLNSKNENNQITSYVYESDTLRPKKTTFPNGGYAETFYSDKEITTASDLVPGYVRQKTTLETNKFVESYSYYDARGLGIRSAAQTPDGWLISAVEYDNLGRVTKSYNPFYGSTPTTIVPEGTKYSEVTAIDALGRITGVTLQDNTSVSTYFSIGSDIPTNFNKTFVTVTDQAGKKRRQVADSLGRIVRVDEPDANGSLGAVDATLPVQQTSYEYDGNDNLAKVIQSDGTTTQERKFMYDSLSRLKAERQVEADATLDLDGTHGTARPTKWTKVLKYNAHGLLTDGYDARGVRTQFAYDGLNRISTVTYSGETGYQTPTVSYTYDQARSGFFNAGALTKVETAQGDATLNPDAPATKTEFDYDLMGRVSKHRQFIGTQEYDLEYGYNLAGQLTSEKYPSGRVVSMGYDTKGRTASISDQSRTYLSGLVYQGNGGSISAMNFGNGTTGTFGLNDRFQMETQELKKGSVTLQKYNYNYGQIDVSNGNITANSNNGQLAKVESWIGTVKQWEQRFAYDSIGRLKESREIRGDDSSLTYKQVFDFDRFGNMYRKAANNGTSGQANPLPYTPIEETTTSGTGDIEKQTNRFRTDTSYDDAGNVVTDNKFRTMGFGYDANGRMVKATKTSVPDAFSVYDARGMRVAERVNDIWRFLIYDIGGKMVAEFGGLQSTDDGGVKYLLSDWQGSTRAVLSNTGVVNGRMDYSTFGEEIGSGTGMRTSAQGFSAPNEPRQKYGLTERDDATGLDQTWFRKHENRAGRWTSPDPYRGSMSMGDPQSFNRYSYVRNEPTNFVDPSGLLESQIWLFPVYCLNIEGQAYLCGYGFHILNIGGGNGGTVVGSGGSSTPPPPTDPCEDILALVAKALKRVADRARELQQDFLNLVPRGIITNHDLERYISNMNDARSPASVRAQGSVESHEDSFRQAQRNLRRRINNFNNNNCGDKGFSLPDKATELAKSNVPGRTRPLPDGSLFTTQDIAVIYVIGVAIYWIVSEASRVVFPPRNLVPVL